MFSYINSSLCPFPEFILQFSNILIMLKYTFSLFFTYVALFSEPLIFLQVVLLPPQIPHLSSFSFEPMTWSQPAFMHWP